MDFHLDDLISTDAANTAKGSKKFQPKGKSKPNAQPEPKSTPTPSTQFVEVAATTEELTGNDVNQINVIQMNLPPCSETPTVDVSMDGKLETGPTEPELINNIDASTNLECIAELDPLTGDEAVILSPGSKEAENSLFWEPPNILAQSVTGSGTRVSKFKPKPKPQSRKMEQIANKPVQDIGPVQHGENSRSAPSQTDFMENEPVPSFTPDKILGTLSTRITDSVPTETISGYHVNEEPITLTQISQVDSVNEAGRSSERLIRLSNKALRLTDEAENGGVDDNNNNNDDYVPENESLAEKKDHKSKPKSKKPRNENKKPIRKRKKVKEVVDESIEVPKKKFSHSTQRNRRQVNPELLKIPEDEFELHMHSYTLKDLIRLREHKERIEKKEASLLGTDTMDQSDQAQNATYYNYGTHMKITPRMKWTKQDTELFYEAIQQFGTDLSIIKECFPGRTREQIRSKFKKEYKQHRLRIESALNTRAKGLSHFEFVIERLKQAQAEDSENDDPVTLTGEENDVISEGGNVGLQKEAKDMEPNVPPAAAESPTKSDDIEDDTWSQYKSEI